MWQVRSSVLSARQGDSYTNAPNPCDDMEQKMLLPLVISKRSLFPVVVFYVHRHLDHGVREAKSMVSCLRHAQSPSHEEEEKEEEK